MRKSSLRSSLYALSGICVFTGVLILLCGGLFAWVLRDGLGPESLTSRGKESWSSFLGAYFPLAYIGLLITFYGLIAGLLGNRLERLSLVWVGLILFLVPLVTCGLTVISLNARSSTDSGPPNAEAVRQAIKKYTEVIGAIEKYRAEQGQYPPHLDALVPEHLSAIPGIYIEGGEIVEYLPLSSFGEPFTFYVYSHDTERTLRQVWEEWELRYCRPDSCTYTSERYPVQRIGDWIWIYRPESRPLLALPIVWLPEPELTPLPGWRLPISTFLMEDKAFPEGCVREQEYPETSDPTINYISRQWWCRTLGDGRANQVIWRAYTNEDAQEEYLELRRQPMLLPNFTPSPWDYYFGFETPTEISFHSQIADEFYLACGWLKGSQCHVIARYRNFVTYVIIDLEMVQEGHSSVGLTYTDIENVVRAMDARIAEVLGIFYNNP